MSDRYEVKVPEMGEGLRYAKVIRFLKAVGEYVEEDTDIAEIETEKALLGVSAPVSGYVSLHACQPGETVDVGCILLEISQEKPSAAQVVNIGRGQTRRRDMPKAAPARSTKPSTAQTLHPKQLVLVKHLRTSGDIVIPASLESRINWGRIDAIKKMMRSQEQSGVPSSLEVICWATAQAMLAFEKFRWQVNRDNEVMSHDNSLIGIAVSADNDTLDTPVIVVKGGDGLSDIQNKMQVALEGVSSEPVIPYHSLVISDMSSYQAFHAQPVVVYPAVATLFIGAPYWTMTSATKMARVSNFVLAFDHRVLNGAYAAKFLQYIDSSIHRLEKELTAQQEGFEDGASIKKFGT